MTSITNKADDNTNTETDSQNISVNIRWYDLCSLGLTIALGGQYFSWNHGLRSGFGSFSIAVLLMGLAYTCMTFCLAELSSTFPFAGGAYGLARCTLGYYFGYIIGCCETVAYIMLAALSTLSFGEMVSSLVPRAERYQPLLWLSVYLVALSINIYGGRSVWYFSTTLGLTVLLILLIFSVGSLWFVDFESDASVSGQWFIGGFYGFLKYMPLSAWMFIGVEALSLTCDDVQEPRKIVPLGLLSCIAVLCVTAVVVVFVCASLPPGLLEVTQEYAPFNLGFRLIFHTISSKVTLLSLPAAFSTSFGFMYGYGKLTVAMASSKLLPSFLIRRTVSSGSPYAALIYNSLFSYGVCVCSAVSPAFQREVYNVCMLSAFLSYMAQCMGFIMLRTKYQHLPREFRSPLGIPGAVLSMVVWLMGIVSIVGFQENNNFPVAALFYVGIVAVQSFLYFFWFQSRQTFSVEERRVMLVAHVINYNDRNVGAVRTIRPRARSLARPRPRRNQVVQQGTDSLHGQNISRSRTALSSIMQAIVASAARGINQVNPVEANYQAGEGEEDDGSDDVGEGELFNKLKEESTTMRISSILMERKTKKALPWIIEECSADEEEEEEEEEAEVEVEEVKDDEMDREYLAEDAAAACTASPMLIPHNSPSTATQSSPVRPTAGATTAPSYTIAPTAALAPVALTSSFSSSRTRAQYGSETDCRSESLT